MAAEYEAMSTMCRHMDAENKRLLQSVADKNVIIAAGLQREQAKAKENVDLYEEHVEWVNKYGELIRDYREMQNDYVKHLAAFKDMSKVLQSDGRAEDAAADRARTRSMTKAERLDKRQTPRQ